MWDLGWQLRLGAAWLDGVCRLSVASARACDQAMSRAVGNETANFSGRAAGWPFGPLTWSAAPSYSLSIWMPWRPTTWPYAPAQSNFSWPAFAYWPVAPHLTYSSPFAGWAAMAWPSSPASWASVWAHMRLIAELNALASTWSNLATTMSRPWTELASAAAPYSSYRSNGGHALAQIVLPQHMRQCAW